MNVFYKALTTKTLLTLAALSIFSQTPIESTIPTNKVLEVTLRSTGPVSRISLQSTTPSGFWTSNIDRLKDWKPLADDKPIQAVNFEARLVEDNVELKVSVFSGSRFRENEHLIATYTLSEGESATIKELSKFGFVSPKIKMVFSAATVASVPIVVNDTKSLKVGIEHQVATLPTVLVKVSNISNKAVSGFSWHTVRANSIDISAAARKLDGKPLILPGESYEIKVRLNDHLGNAETASFNVGAVVFVDGTYEGNVETSAQFRAWKYSEKDTLEKIIPTLKLSIADVSSRPNIAELIKSIEADKRPIARSTIESLLAEFPEHQPLHNKFAGWLRRSPVVMREVINPLKALEKASAGRSDAEINLELAALIQRLQEWLDRLSK